MHIGGAVAKVPAVGTWKDDVLVASTFILPLHRSLPSTNLLKIRVEDGRFFVDEYSVPVSPSSPSTAAPFIPLGASLAYILTLPLRFSWDEISQAGLMEEVVRAQRKRDRLVKQAAEALAPLGIWPDQVERLVDERVEKLRRLAEEEEA